MAAERIGGACAALLLAALWSNDAQACRCPPLPLAEYAARAEVILLAEIAAVRTETREDGQVLRVADFTLLHGYKNAGGMRGLQAPDNAAACGLSMISGERYWIFGRLAAGGTAVETHSCSGSRQIDQPFVDTDPKQVGPALEQLTADLDCPDPAPAEIAARLSLQAAPRGAMPQDGMHSPNGAYRFALDNPDAIRRPPRIARLWVDHERETLLQLSMHGVAAPVGAQWINEKLVLVHVPWSRQLRSDLLLDVEAARLRSVDTARLDDDGRVLRWLDAGCREQP